MSPNPPKRVSEKASTSAARNWERPKKLRARIGAAGSSWARRATTKENRNEALVFLAIAILFAANVILYLCHHWGLTSANQPHAQRMLAPVVILN